MNLNTGIIEFNKSTLCAEIKKVLRVSGKKLVFFILLLALPAALIMGAKYHRYAETLFAQWNLTDLGDETSVLLMLSEFSQVWGNALPQILLDSIYEVLIGVQISFVIIITYEALQGGGSFAQNPLALIKLVLRKLLWIMLFYYLFRGFAKLVMAPIISFAVSIAVGIENFLSIAVAALLVLWMFSVMVMVFSYFPVMCACILFSRARILVVPYFSHYLLKKHFIRNFFQTGGILFFQSVVVGSLMLIPLCASISEAIYAPLLWVFWAILVWVICSFSYLFYTVRFAYLEREGIVNLAKEGKVVFVNGKGEIRKDFEEVHDENQNHEQ